MQHMLSENIGFITTRQTKEDWDIKVSNLLIDNKSLAAYDTNSLFPLYKYPESRNSRSTLFSEKIPNFSSDFMIAIQEKLGYLPTPETIFHYIYAVFHSPTYRQRYAELLKMDFPCVPLTRNDRLFQDLATKGQELVDLHLMNSKKLNKLITTIGGDGNNSVTEVTYHPSEQRVYINKTCYFQGITPDLWTFQIGGYQVLDKWLKDRKKAKRILSFDEVLHYQKIVVVLKETMQIMLQIDQLIPTFPLE
jgi:predicted helicase